MKYFFQSIKSIIKSYYCWTIILIILLLQNTDLGQRFHIKPFKDLFTFWVLWCKHFSRRELLLKSTNIGFIRVLIADGKLIFVLYVSFPLIWLPFTPAVLGSGSKKMTLFITFTFLTMKKYCTNGFFHRWNITVLS